MENTNNASGVGFLGLLQITFIVLKLCKVIEWSWWWVFSPIWIPAVISFSVFLIVFTLYWFSNKNN